MPEISDAQAQPMPMSRKVLCGGYAAIAAVALIATWSQNLAYQSGTADLFSSFLRDTTVTPASRSITADIVLFFLAAAILMVIEGRKHGVRLIWAYIVGGLFVAISVTFPLFLIARELRINATAGAAAPRLAVKDTVLLGILAVLSVGMVFWVDTH
jgi:hypothetical protein